MDTRVAMPEGAATPRKSGSSGLKGVVLCLGLGCLAGTSVLLAGGHSSRLVDFVTAIFAMPGLMVGSNEVKDLSVREYEIGMEAFLNGTEDKLTAAKARGIGPEPGSVEDLLSIQLDEAATFETEMSQVVAGLTSQGAIKDGYTPALAATAAKASIQAAELAAGEGKAHSAVIAAGRAAGAAILGCMDEEEAAEAGEKVGALSQSKIDAEAATGLFGQSYLANEAAINALTAGLDIARFAAIKKTWL